MNVQRSLMTVMKMQIAPTLRALSFAHAARAMKEMAQHAQVKIFCVYLKLPSFQYYEVNWKIPFTQNVSHSASTTKKASNQSETSL